MATINVAITLTPACHVVNHITFHVTREESVSEIADQDVSDAKAWIVGHRKNTANHVNGMTASHKKTHRNTTVTPCSEDGELRQNNLAPFLKPRITIISNRIGRQREGSLWSYCKLVEDLG